MINTAEVKRKTNRDKNLFRDPTYPFCLEVQMNTHFLLCFWKFEIIN